MTTNGSSMGCWSAKAFGPVKRFENVLAIVLNGLPATEAILFSAVGTFEGITRASCDTSEYGVSVLKSRANRGWDSKLDFSSARTWFRCTATCWLVSLAQPRACRQPVLAAT